MPNGSQLQGGRKQTLLKVPLAMATSRVKSWPWDTRWG